MQDHQQANPGSEELTAGSTVRVGTTTIGPDSFALIATIPLGLPAEVAVEAAGAARTAGARLILGRLRRHDRGDAERALGILAECKLATRLPAVVDVTTPELAVTAAGSADMLLLRGGGIADPEVLGSAGRTGLPCLLERTPGAGIDSWLRAATTLAQAGAAGVVLCAPASGAEPPAGGLDLSSVPVLRERSGLPVVVDPSPLRAQAAAMAALARAAAAVGADGVVVEAPLPDSAVGGHRLDGTDLASLISEIHAVAAVTGRRPTPGRIRYVSTR
jgi:3-deoxy-7-phosphoheptulonate synthase